MGKLGIDHLFEEYDFTGFADTDPPLALSEIIHKAVIGMQSTFLCGVNDLDSVVVY